MRSYVRLFSICVAAVLAAALATEQPQKALANKPDSAGDGDLCISVVQKGKHDWSSTFLRNLVNNQPASAVKLLWDSLLRPESNLLLSDSLQRLDGSTPLILGLPEDNASPPPRSFLTPAQIVNVSVNNNFFSPANITITAGDTVRWTWISGPHSVTSGDCCDANGQFCSPSNLDCSNSPASEADTQYSHTFNTTGQFPYFCNVHLGAMTGSVTVNAPSQSTTVQFSASSAPVTETLNATTNLDLTVTRTGDSSNAATIEYASSDGTASERSDYLAALGTLHFAAAETSKTITVFIVDDRFGETPETFNVNLTNPIGCTLGSPATFTVTINSDEMVNGLNPVKDASFNSDFFVREHYVDFFNREADAGGLAFWKNQIDECSTQACREIRRINVSAAFFVSIEFQQTGYLVYKTYQAAFNSGEFLKLRNFLPDTQEIGRGVVIGQPGAEAQLEANKQRFFMDFVQRATFLAPTAYPTTMTAAQFVDKLNANTYDPQNPGAGALTQSERDALIAQLSPDPSSPTLRAQVLHAVAENGVFNARQLNKAFVLMQYFGYLRRNPNDPPEAGLDFAGYNFWLGKLNQFNGNFVNAEMVKAFIVSGEYQQRFGP
ncbi:MAG: Calx-beta domain-containing protein [Pyrinomonadaceae bacterium]